MFTSSTLLQSVRPAVYARGRMIAEYSGSFLERSCSYRGAQTNLQAFVKSSSGYQMAYDVELSVDEAQDELVNYSCNCPAARKFFGPCKHVVALGLDYLERPELYEGYDDKKYVSTSHDLAFFLDRQEQKLPVPSTVSTEAPGSLRLIPHLGGSLAGDRFSLGFDISGSQGSYVIKNIGDFIDRVRDEEIHTYGKKLTAAHTQEAFDPFSWDIVQWLERAVQNRRNYAYDDIYGRSFGGYGSSSGVGTGRELKLSYPELDEFVSLQRNRSVYFTLSTSYERRSKKTQQTHRVVIEEGDPDIHLDVLEADSGAYELQRSNETIIFFSSLKHLYALHADRFYICSERLFKLRDFILSVYCSAEETLKVSAEDAPRFAAMVLPELQESLGTTAPAALEALKPVEGTLTFLLDVQDDEVTLRLIASYGDDEYELIPLRIETERDLRRDLVAEARARQLATRYFNATGGKKTLPMRWTLPLGNSEALGRLLFSGLIQMREIGEVRSTSAFDRLISPSQPNIQWHAHVDSDLLQLEVSADDLPLSELHALLSSYRKRKHYHRLRDGSLMDISELDLSESASLVDELGISASELARGNVNMPSYKAFLLNAMLAEEDKDPSFEQWIDDFEHIDPERYKAPSELASVLRPYQLKGFQWLSALADMGFGGILADEMGLGKTVQMIGFLLTRRGQGRSLVVCPASLVYNWQEEFAKFAPQLDIAVVAGTAAQRRSQRDEAAHEVLITSYDLLRRDIQAYVDETFSCVILDEAQYVKNHQTLAAHAVKELHARHRFALTGTPIENRLSELWSIFDFLMPGLLGSYQRFRERYEQPIAAGDDMLASRLQAAVGPFILRRLKRKVLVDLPEKLETTVVAHMEKEQRTLYHAHEQALRLSLEKQSDAQWNKGKVQVLAELMRLRQLCCDPRLAYEDYTGPSCKIDMIWDLVSSSKDAGSKVLIFSQFTSYLQLVAHKLSQEGVAFFTLTGSTPKEERMRLVREFNRDDTPVFLISLRAGGTGLNLVGAQVVIHADPWWNVAVENQATDRAHRIGQKSDVSVYKIICKDTIEERIVKLQEKKADLADAVVGTGGGSGLGSLAREDLINLLS